MGFQVLSQRQLLHPPPQPGGIVQVAADEAKPVVNGKKNTRPSEQFARFPFLAMAPWESVPSAREVVAQLQANSTNYVPGFGILRDSSRSGKRRRIQLRVWGQSM